MTFLSDMLLLHSIWQFTLIALPVQHGSMAVQVLDAEGKPVEGAHVTLCDPVTGFWLMENSYRPLSEELEKKRGAELEPASATTDRNGRVRFNKLPVGAYRVLAQSWKDAAPPETVFHVGGRTVRIHGVADRVDVVSEQTVEVTLTPLGTGTLRINDNLNKDGVLTVVSLSAPQADPMLMLAGWFGPFMRKMVAWNAKPAGPMTIEGLPEGTVHVGCFGFAADDMTGNGAGQAKIAAGLDAAVEVKIDISYGERLEPPARLKELIDKMQTAGTRQYDQQVLLTNGITPMQVDSNAELWAWFRWVSENLSRELKLPGGGMATFGDVMTASWYATTKKSESTQRKPDAKVQAPGRPATTSPNDNTVRQSVSIEGGKTFPTIQKALDAAQENAVVHVPAGRYDEYLKITRPVTLVGAGWDKTTVGPVKPWSPPGEAQIRKIMQKISQASSEEEKRGIQLEFMAQQMKPVIQIRDAGAVRLENLRITLPGVSSEGRLSTITALHIQNTVAHLNKIAIVGSPGDGIQVGQDAQLDIRDSLIAAAWNTGIRVGSRQDERARAEITDCDVRNCYYAGIVFRNCEPSRVERCRISGAAWHGIRYDDVSPEITRNLIFRNARSGIYASGKTNAKIDDNSFYENEMNGISCWFQNHDVIRRNSFMQNGQEGVTILGASEPTIHHNVFVDHPAAVVVSEIGSSGANAQPTGTVNIRNNFFLRNQHVVVRRVPVENEEGWEFRPIDLPSDGGDQDIDPRLRDPNGDFSVTDMPLGLKSPWPLQPEEQAIIPDDNTRDSRSWKRPGF